MKQYITFNFIIELKEKLTYSYPMLCYSQQWPWFGVDWNTNCLSQLGNYIYALQISVVSKEKLDHSQFNSWTFY